ncbi:MAG: glutamate--tRNA ligase [bacterium]|nr:glutamate--tRNA ligase [bacterium]
MSVRVRFAPSPTGYLHIGSLRTALYNYLYAKHNGGTCILRVEDTDRTRLVEGAIEEQIESLRWAGIVFDEGPHIGGDFGPYIQSERFHLYNQYGMQLVESGHAYYAFDTSEELDAMRARQQAAGIAPKYDRSSMRNQYTIGDDETANLLAVNAPHVIRLKVPLQTDVHFHDDVRGDMVVGGREIDDQILVKSDGFPTYHLANVVDDHLMEITHVIRGEEWLPSTPKHILLYEAFGWKPPSFSHLPLLLNADRSKMSKRHGDVMVQDFRAKGYFPQALVNYVSLCGWNPGSDREIYSLSELVDVFTLERVNKAGAVFDYKKLDWMNGEYLKAMDPKDLAAELMPELSYAGYTYTEPSFVANVAELLRERVTFLKDIAVFGDYLFTDGIPALSELTEEASKPLGSSETLGLLRANDAFMTALRAFRADFNDDVANDHDGFKALAQASAEANGLKLGAFMKPLRLVLTHRDVGADLFRTVQLLGAKRCITRIDGFLS